MIMKDEDLKTETIRVGPIGGMHTGMDPQEVKITHIPTGIYASCHIYRSQHKNREIARAMIEYGLAEMDYKDSIGAIA